MINIAIIGGTGYGGIELLRLLHQHPNVQVRQVISSSNNGSSITENYPHLHEISEHQLMALDVKSIGSQVDLVFLATPPGVSSQLVPQLLEVGVACVDLSGDFRLLDPQLYPLWYKYSHPAPTYLEQAVYGLCELNARRLPGAKLVANPGCYPTASLLGLLPAVEHELVELDSIAIDGKSGVSGAGRKVGLGTHYCEVNENLSAYKLGSHQHIPEIEQCLSQVAKLPITVSFTTHLVPMTRGLMCTIYAKLKSKMTTADAIGLYQEFYEAHPFVRIKPAESWPATKQVYGSNYCDIGVLVDSRTQRLIVVSAIDNLVKGAAGQGIQNMNLIYGWPETTGLINLPVYP